MNKPELDLYDTLKAENAELRADLASLRALVERKI
jgi:hypothetical protein